MTVWLASAAEAKAAKGEVLQMKVEEKVNETAEPNATEELKEQNKEKVGEKSWMIGMNNKLKQVLAADGPDS